jgi:hypothetical protein
MWTFAMLRTPLSWLAVSLVLFVASGASCPWMLRQPGAPIPAVLPQAATLEQVLSAVNDNTARVRSGVASQAQLSVPGAPRLAADVAFEMPRRFRLKASLAMTGPEVDLGMNDELFWLWVRRNQPPATFFCRHDQFAASSARRIMPVEPDWLVEAMGLTTFQPQDEPQGPIPVGAGRLRIQSRRRTATGDMTKITVVDAARAVVLEQHLYDAQGQPIASAITSNHVRDGVSGANMPRQIELRLPTAQLQMRIDVADWQLNTLGPDHGGIWVKPDYSHYGAPDVDLADPSLQFNVPAQPLTGASVDPRANGGMRMNHPGGGPSPQVPAAALLARRAARLERRMGQEPSVGASAMPAEASPPAIELPWGNGTWK